MKETRFAENVVEETEICVQRRRETRRQVEDKTKIEVKENKL